MTAPFNCRNWRGELTLAQITIAKVLKNKMVISFEQQCAALFVGWAVAS